MIFVGDFATNERIEVTGLEQFSKQHFILNLEGYVRGGSSNRRSDGIFTSSRACDYFSATGFTPIFALANNHISDTERSLTSTLEYLDAGGFGYCGAGREAGEAGRPFRFSENGIEFSLVNAGWEVIGCKAAKTRTAGVSVIEERKLVRSIRDESNSGRFVLVFLHWNYELELYPHPTHRSLAKALIDAGANAVLGCHSHCINGYEMYRGRPIFYGLGNFYFREGFYWEGKLVYPEIAKNGLLVEYDSERSHWFVALTSKTDNGVEIAQKKSIADVSVLAELSTFTEVSDDLYPSWFRANRRKKMFVPVFHERDATLRYRLKVIYFFFRAQMITLLVRIGIKKNGPR